MHTYAWKPKFYVCIINKVFSMCSNSKAKRQPLRPVHLLRVFLLGVLESNFPGDSL